MYVIGTVIVMIQEMNQVFSCKWDELKKKMLWWNSMAEVQTT